MKLLVIRFSAMGDVALTVPVLRSLTDAYPALQVTLVTQKQFVPFFYNLINVKAVGIDLSKYKGISGIYKIYKLLEPEGPFDRGIDLHDSLRSRILRFYFWFKGLRFFQINKNRTRKRELTRKKNKKLQQLPHVTELYKDVFNRAGFRFELVKKQNILVNHQQDEEVKRLISSHGKIEKLPGEKWIGIAPFAKHANKIWPIEKMKELIRRIGEKHKARIFLFGGGKKELGLLQQMRQQLPNVIVVSGLLNLEAEINLVGQLDAMISMDSFNMHLAALLGVNTISIWGPTHAYAGFGPVGQPEENRIEVAAEKLSCRPCSVFGNKICFRGDLACMNWITTGEVMQKLEERVFSKIA